MVFAMRGSRDRRRRRRGGRRTGAEVRSSCSAWRRAAPQAAVARADQRLARETNIHCACSLSREQFIATCRADTATCVHALVLHYASIGGYRYRPSYLCLPLGDDKVPPSALVDITKTGAAEMPSAEYLDDLGRGPDALHSFSRIFPFVQHRDPRHGMTNAHIKLSRRRLGG